MIFSLVDAHCHLDLYPNFESLIDKCERERIYTLTVTTTPKAWERNYSLTTDKQYVKAALGLHPQLVSERAKEIHLWDKYLSEARFIGEVGLDAGPRYYKSFGLQEEIFKHILLACKGQGDKVLTVHSVRSVPKVLSMIEQYLFPGTCKVILHWFSGSISNAVKAIELGCFFSINMEMLRNPKNFDLINTIPIHQILTETDGPFTKLDDVVSQPRDVEKILVKLSLITKKPKEEWQKAIAENFVKI